MRCLTCKHCTINAEEPGYGEYTPGSPAWWRCGKNVWDIHVYDLDKDGILKLFQKGERCAHWEDDGRK